MKPNQLFELIERNHVLYLARGGGGGSSSHSSSSSSSHSSSSSSHRSSTSGGTGGSEPAWLTFLIIGLSFGIPILVIILILKFGKKVGGVSALSAVPAGFIDPEKDAASTKEEKDAVKRSQTVFVDFQKSWSDFDLKKMEKITSPEYFKKMTLELNVLKNYKRQNVMDDVKILGAYIMKNGEYAQGYHVFFQAQATDKLVDTQTSKTIYTDTNAFSELWTFTKKGKDFVLADIAQTTVEASKFDSGIAQFAASNGFYYDPDFGWLMMPSRGAIFGPAGFGNADLNNHVIGYYGKGIKAKIVEFYSYEPKAGVGMEPITVAQAILPKSYDDILVTEKSWYNFKPKGKGLNKIETESVEFNKKFAVWAANQDQATSFELLATNFMERIYALGFEINIEVVDNVLYLYSPSKNISYGDMLEVLSWAFDEMKM